MLVDSHSHPNFEAYEEDRDAVLSRCQEKGMKLIAVGSQLATSRLAVEQATKNSFISAAVGQHPIHVLDEQFDFDAYMELATRKEVVALGETGLDRYRVPEGVSADDFIAKQKELLLQHIKVAQATGKALILHCREAYDELADFLAGIEDLPKGVVHCFIGTPAQAQRFLDLGFYIGVTGIVTFKNAGDVVTIATEVPLEKLLIETDAPYLTPVPYRGKRNEPVYVEYVAEKIAELKGLSKEDVIEATGQNAIHLFNLR